MKNQHEKNSIEQLVQTFRKSVIIKLSSIFTLMILLMIPMAFIKSLISEREDLNDKATQEVSGKWAYQQRVFGPILTVPFTKTYTLNNRELESTDSAHFLPNTLTIDADINPKSLNRGIYEVVVYDSKLTFSGSYIDLKDYEEKFPDYNFHWNDAYLTVNISDLRGIENEIVVEWAGEEKPVVPGSSISSLIKSGITITNIFDSAPDSKIVDFSFDLNLQGSHYLGFVPLGKETTINARSGWPDPSFAGAFLPDSRSVSDSGFTASYNILELNRSYPQFWIGNRYVENITNSELGVNLLLPMNDYLKAMRSAKYALLAIVLTFLTFFLVEIFNRTDVHPFQYILIGLALCLFYTLLISISEHYSFDIAYIISSIAIISMIGLYAKSIMRNFKQTAVLILVLCITYSFVYITLQVQDYALLIGSVGLTLILAITMFITRKINWYDIRNNFESPSAGKNPKTNLEAK